MSERAALHFEVSDDAITLGNRTMIYRSDVAGEGRDEDGLRFWNLVAAAVRSASSSSAGVSDQ